MLSIVIWFYEKPFIKFDNLEGLIHISELAWQRIDNPGDVIKIGEEVKAQIIEINGTKIFLSIKKIADDPWKDVAEKYNTGDIVEGTVLKINPFGLFVELDKNIHGLAHISELSNENIKDLKSFANIGETRNFKILSIDATNHRLGLSVKALDENDRKSESKKDSKKKEKSQPETDQSSSSVTEKTEDKDKYKDKDKKDKEKE